MTDWWVGIAPAERSVSCGGEHHRLRWEQGRLVACDHGDPDDELVLAALGGQELQCIELVRAWERHRDDLRVLVIGPRGGIDELPPGSDAQPAGSRAIGRSRSGTRSRNFVGRSHRGVSNGGHPEPNSAADDLAELTTLTALGGGLGERLVATVAAEWNARLRDGHPDLADATARLQAALYGRVCAALRRWLGDPQLSPELEMTAPEHARSLSREEGVVHAQLPFAWLVDVWARDLTTVQGRFCLDAKPGSTAYGERWELATVAPDLRSNERIELRISPGPGA
jgi:hypothetical protein